MQPKQLLSELNDSSFQAMLMQNAHQALQSVGVNVPAGTQVNVVRNTKKELNLVIPPNSDNRELVTDEELEIIGAGEIIIAVLGVGAAVASIAVIVGLAAGNVGPFGIG